MESKLLYVPVLRSRQQEDAVLKTFDFEEQMYPLVEIFKEHDRAREKQKKFEDIHIPYIEAIKAKKVFIDLPTYLVEKRNTKPEIISFNRRVLTKYDKRIEYVLKLSVLSDKIIPVVSSFIKTDNSHRIAEQEAAFRAVFKSLGFRIPVVGFHNYLDEIRGVITASDYLIVDFDSLATYETPSLTEIFKEIKSFEICPVIIIRSSINNDVQNTGLNSGEIVPQIDNSLLQNFRNLGASAFGDYCGVKKDDMTEGGGISPGFLYYNATKNHFVGFKGEQKDLNEFERTIVPGVLNSVATRDMINSRLPYLIIPNNVGWSMINRIQAGQEKGKSQAKFKRIAIEHYLHSVKTLINANMI